MFKSGRKKEKEEAKGPFKITILNACILVKRKEKKKMQWESDIYPTKSAHGRR